MIIYAVKIIYNHPGFDYIYSYVVPLIPARTLLFTQKTVTVITNYLVITCNFIVITITFRKVVVNYILLDWLYGWLRLAELRAGLLHPTSLPKASHPNPDFVFLLFFLYYYRRLNNIPTNTSEYPHRLHWDARNVEHCFVCIFLRLNCVPKNKE